MRRHSLILAAALALGLTSSAFAAEEAARLEHKHWTFEGPLGTFDQAQLQRGYKVYQEVCSACHSMNLLSFRNLGEKYGPFYTEEFPNPNENGYVKALAAEAEINDIDTETGDAIKRPGTPADRFPNPFPNQYAAAAGNGGAVPPDLSVITKARHGGANYIYSILTGYAQPPAGLTVPDGMNYNNAMHGDLSPHWAGDMHEMPPGGYIAMKAPLAPNKVAFDDGTASTVEQQAADVSAFLAWASEPKQIERKQIGIWVMGYLILLAGLAYASYRRVWRNESH